MDRIILHIDVNNAFLSWTATYMLKKGYKYDIRNRYAIIAGDESQRRGIVLAKSNLCKKCGVVTAEAIYSARRKCPYLEIYKPNYELYKYFSDKMYNYLCQYTDIIERYSIDECFLDYTGSMKLFGDPIEVAYKIKNDIFRLFGFTVNVGIGNNKLLAKMASDFEKPNKVHTLYKEEIKTKMWKLPVTELFMVGRRSMPKLQKMGIKTIGDLAQSDENKLIKNLGKYGKMIWEYSNGIDNEEVNYIKEKHPELNDLYNKIYTKKDMSYWERLDKKVQEYANKNGFMYVIDEEPFLKNPTGKPIIINYFYHEKIRQLSKNK